MILLVVWSANGDGSAFTSKTSSKINLLNDDTYQLVYATVTVDKCAIYKKILDLLDEESVSGACSG